MQTHIVATVIGPMLSEETLTTNFLKLETETSILKKLLFRNKNQHGPTKLHQHLRGVCHEISLSY